MSDPAGTNRKQVRRAAWSFLLYVMAAAAAALAAWQVQRFYAARDAPAPAPRKTLRFRTGTAGETGDRPGPSTNPSDWIVNPLAASSLRAMNSDPDGIAPPDGAVRLSAYQGTSADQRLAYGRYSYGGSMSAAAEYYRDVLARRGFRVLGDRSDGQTSRRLLGFRGEVSVNVVLRKPPQDGKIMSIVLMVSRPGESVQSPQTQGR